MYRNVYDPGPKDKDCCRVCANYDKVENYCHLKERYYSSGYLCVSFEKKKRGIKIDRYNVPDRRDEG